MRKVRLGELSAYVRGGEDGEGGGDGPLVVLMHGYGAAGTDLVDLAEYVPAAKALRWVFPEAPLALDAGPGRAWWPLDADLFERRMLGARIDRSGELPPRLATARTELSSLLDAIESELGVPRSQQLLGGFSQGSMLAVDQALHAEQRPRGLILLSSTLIAAGEWAPRMERLRDLPVLQTHGSHDVLLPFAAAERLRDLLIGGGAKVEFVPFEGGHELPPTALRALSKFVQSES